MNKKMETKAQITKELEGLAPTLARLKKQHRPHQVPEGYFEQLPSAVLQRAEASGRARLYVLKGRNRRRPAYRWAAAAVAALLGAAFYLWQPPPPQASLATLSSEEAEAYIIEHIGDFELNLILETGWPDKPAGSEIDFMPELTPDDLEMYLEEVDWL
jgi:hypothetical protein